MTEKFRVLGLDEFDDLTLDEEVDLEEFKELEPAGELEAPSGGFKLPAGYASNSQVEMYLRCPKQYEFRYVKKISRPPSVAATQGSGIHHALEHTHHHIVDKGVPAPTSELEDVFSGAFEAVKPDIPKEAWEQEGVTEGALKDMGIKLVRLYNTQFAPKVKPQVKDGVRGIEKRFEIMVAGVPMVGIIDLIDSNAEGGVTDIEKEIIRQHGGNVSTMFETAIADFKTKAKSMSSAEIESSMQLTLYSYAEQIPLVRFDQLLKLKTPKITRTMAMRTTQDHQWMRQVVHGVATAIHAGVFPPCSPTAWCCSSRWCGFYGQCRGRKR